MNYKVARRIIPRPPTPSSRSPSTKTTMANAVALNQWQTEAALVATLEAHVGRQASTTGNEIRLLLREYDTGMGKPDLLAISLARDTLRKRARSLRRKTVPQLSRAASYAISMLDARGSASDGEIREWLRLSRRRTHETIEILTSRGLACFESGVVALVDTVHTFAIKHIDAYEAKLADWKAVAEQAVRHHWFASRSFVVMPPRSPLVTKPLIDLCDEMRIGLAFLSPLAELELLRNQPSQLPSRTPLTWTLNEKAVDELRDDLV